MKEDFSFLCSLIVALQIVARDIWDSVENLFQWINEHAHNFK